MTTATTAPMTITDEAAARIDELGLRSHFETMIEHLRQVVPDLLRIEVEAQWDPCERELCRIMIWAYRPPHLDPYMDDPTNRNWVEWIIQAFPPEVFMHFVMSCAYEAENGR